MMRRVHAGSLAAIAILALASAAGRAQGRSAAPARVSSTDAVCASDLGTGVKTQRRFCDVVITSNPAESVAMRIPPHVGAAVLTFDLHDRFDVSTRLLQPLLFERQTATIAVLRSTGTVLDRAVVLGELRLAADAFDRIQGGAAPGGVKAVAPGTPMPVRVTIPVGVTAIGIVGIRLASTGANGATEVFETPGRPIAVVSNLKIEYTPRS